VPRHENLLHRGGPIVGTTNGGARFTETSLPGAGYHYNLGDITCPSTHVCYAVGDGGVIIANTALPSNEKVTGAG
jgi:hypothetical protein